MKKVVLLITILFVSVISTACINNLAVQELNSKAKEYMAAGETDKAICRLRSSIDLDTSIFETHYNLGVALIEAKDFDDAEASLENAINLKPEFADAYYSLAVAFESEADELISPTKDDKDNDKEEAKTADKKKELSFEDKTKAVELYNKSVENYNTYLAKKPSADDKSKVEEHITYLNSQIAKYNSDRGTSIDDTPKSPSSED